VILEAELWAQEGIDVLVDPYRRMADRLLPDGTREHVPVEIDLVEATLLLRAAYAQGYLAALKEPEPDPVEASGKAVALRLILPA